MILYQEGNKIPYITSDPNDPRIQARKDSLDAYNHGENSLEFLKSIYDEVRAPYNSEFREYYDLVPQEWSDTAYTYGDTGLKPISGYNEYYTRKPLTIWEKIVGDKAPNYYKGKNGEHWAPMGTFWNRWKKPEQEVVYKPEQDSVVDLPQIEVKDMDYARRLQKYQDSSRLYNQSIDIGNRLADSMAAHTWDSRGQLTDPEDIKKRADMYRSWYMDNLRAGEPGYESLNLPPGPGMTDYAENMYNELEQDPTIQPVGDVDAVELRLPKYKKPTGIGLRPKGVERMQSRGVDVENQISTQPRSREFPQQQPRELNRLRRRWNREEGRHWTYGPDSDPEREKFDDKQYHEYRRQGFFNQPNFGYQ